MDNPRLIMLWTMPRIIVFALTKRTHILSCVGLGFLPFLQFLSSGDKLFAGEFKCLCGYMVPCDGAGIPSRISFLEYRAWDGNTFSGFSGFRINCLQKMSEEMNERIVVLYVFFSISVCLVVNSEHFHVWIIYKDYKIYSKTQNEC